MYISGVVFLVTGLVCGILGIWPPYNTRFNWVAGCWASGFAYLLCTHYGH